MGARVTLITGSVNPPIPPFTRHYCAGGQEKGGRGGVINVVSAREMFAAVKKHYRSADIIICAAAVSDFRPVKFSRQKIKKQLTTTPHPTLSPEGRGKINGVTLKLTKNPDTLHWLGRHKRRGQKLVGFSLETEHLIKNATAKLKDKNCDLIVANLASAIGRSKSSAVIILKNGKKIWLKNQLKSKVARAIFNLL